MTQCPEGPLVVFDGDCRFCHRAVARLRRWAGAEIPARAYQELEPGFAGISCAEAERAVQYIDAAGVRHQAAAAVVEALAAHGGPRWPQWIYQNVPVLARWMEAVYGWVARHRQGISAWERALDGPAMAPPTYDTAMGWWVRGVGLMFAVAFASLGAQAEGLYGARGVWPVAEWLGGAARAGAGIAEVPSVFWAGAGDAVLQAVWVGGLVCGLAAAAGILQGPMLMGAWVAYLSFAAVGGPFMSFQWDALLLECGVLAMLGAGWGWRTRGGPCRHPALLRWMVWWVLFKLMFFSGVVKLASGDRAWSTLAALGYHFETQPLPNPPAWWMHHLPEIIQAGMVAGMFVIQLVLPWLIVLARRLRRLAAVGFAALQLGIMATGNYGFFNLLGLLLVLTLVDDDLLRRVVGRKAGAASGRPGRVRSGLCLAWAVPVMVFAVFQTAWAFRWEARPLGLLAEAMNALQPLRSINSYGLFAVMTQRRPEITLQGSADGVVWKDYVYAWKPGPMDRPPPWVPPGHMPRLDWQMWFAALGDLRRNPWLANLARRLLEGAPEVEALLAENPFPDKPPLYVRAVVHDYRFTTPEERVATGTWWKATYAGIYLPPVRLEDFR